MEGKLVYESGVMFLGVRALTACVTMTKSHPSSIKCMEQGYSRLLLLL